MSLADIIDPLDKPIYGARQIAECLNLINKHGQPNSRMAYHYLEGGHVDAAKIGDGEKTLWWSTPRRLLRLPPEARAALVPVPVQRSKPKAKQKAKAGREVKARAKREAEIAEREARKRKDKANRLKAKAAKLSAEAAALERQPEAR
jgi:hypothetical protein